MEQEKKFIPPTEHGEKPSLTPYQETLELAERIAEKIKRREFSEEEAQQFCDVFFRNLNDIGKLDFFEKLPLFVKLTELRYLFLSDELFKVERSETEKRTEGLIELVKHNVEAIIANGIIFDIYKKNRPIEDLGSEKIEMLLEVAKTAIINGNSCHLLALKDFFEKYDAQFQKLSQKSKKTAAAYGSIKNFLLSPLAEINLAYSIEDEERMNRGFLFRPENEKALAWLESTLHKYGLPAKEMLRSWFSHRESIPRIGFNIHRITEIERENPGIAKFLYQTFGIRNFERYPAELLNAAFKEYEDLDKPYGILINPTNDYNGAFSYGYCQWQDLFDQLQEQGYALRIVEAGGKVELAKHLIRLDRKYGPRQKISFVIIGGHGTKNSIQFGGNERVNKLYASDLWGTGTKKALHFFKEKAPFILGSCSTGVEGGIGQEASQIADTKFIAPDRLSSIKSIEVARGAVGLDFIGVEYITEDGKVFKGRVYQGGEEVK